VIFAVIKQRIIGPYVLWFFRNVVYRNDWKVRNVCCSLFLKNTHGTRKLNDKSGKRLVSMATLLIMSTAITRTDS